MRFVVGAQVARYLGPEDYGTLSYVLAFTALFSPLGKLGIDGIVAREIVLKRFQVDKLLSTSIFLKFSGSILLVLAVFFFISFKENVLYTYMAVVVAFASLFKSLDALAYYFRAKVNGKIIGFSNMLGILGSSGFKVLLILLKVDLIYFAIATLLESIIISGLYFYYFKKENTILSLNLIDGGILRVILLESWPLFVGSFFALIYLNIDQVMIEYMLGSHSVGIYGAAARISTAFYFIPMTLGWATQTYIVNAKKKGESAYAESLKKLFTISVLCAYILILVTTIFSDVIMLVTFGDEFKISADILKIHIWSSLFIFLGSIRGLWLISDSHTKFDLLSNITAGFTNVTLNYILLNMIGVVGAAWATLVSYAMTYFVSSFFYAPARSIGNLQVRAILLLDIIPTIKSIKNNILIRYGNK